MKTSIQRACRLAVLGVSVAPAFVLAAPSVDRLNPATPNQQNVGAVAPTGALVLPTNVYVPDSSRQLPADLGKRAHTNYFIHNVTGVQPQRLSDLAVPEPAAEPGANPDNTFTEYPASLACVYGMGKAYAGCKPLNNKKYNSKGGERAIALVDAYDDPTASSDLSYFSQFFGLPAAQFTKVYANGNGSCSVPPFDAGWAFEESIDVQWAHAMAPSAQIILVEACSNSYADLMYAEQIAEQQVLAFGGGEISNSWSGGEWSTESSDYDWVFRSNWTAGKPITILASAGDAGLGPQFPSVSPWVVSAGGTTINRDASGNFQNESCWSFSGGGTSAYETYSNSFGSGTGPWTNFQYPFLGESSRATPDIAFDADPNSGAYTYYNGQWYVGNGTSLASPSLAGIMNVAGNRQGMAPAPGGYYSNMENNLLYAELATQKDYFTNFYDVTTGSNGAAAVPGWDSCTGVGTPRGHLGK